MNWVRETFPPGEMIFNADWVDFPSCSTTTPATDM